MWDGPAKATGRSKELINWLQLSELDIIPPINLHMYTRGNKFDLTFSDLQGAKYKIKEHLQTASDHRTLVHTFCERKFPFYSHKI